MRAQGVFIDSGAWIALPLTKDPHHALAKELWDQLIADSINLYSSIPVVIETFTFLERNVERRVTLQWKDLLSHLRSEVKVVTDKLAGRKGLALWKWRTPMLLGRQSVRLTALR